MNHSIERLRDGIQELINTHSNASKIYIIRSLFDLLDDAIKNRISIDMLVTYLNENHVIISKHYLKNTLLRIRRERGISPQKRSTQDLNAQHQNQTQTVVSDKSLATPKTEIDYQARYDDIDRRYKAANTAEEKYAILGGDPKKLDGHPPRKQREMCIQLKMKIHNQYKPFIKF
jgi:hypothetical protein